MNQEKIGKFITECRKQKNLTQNELADKLGITDKAISKWENGRCMPDISLLEELCSILGVTINELLSGERNTNNSSDKIIIDSLEVNERQFKKILQGSMLLGCSVAFNIATIIFGATNQMVVVFGGITFSFIIAGIITLLKRK